MKNYVFMLLMSLLLISCGGGSGGSGGGGGLVDTDTPVVVNNGLDSSVGNISGVLLDEKVEGVDYSSTSFSGTTNGTGNFSCKAGETVTFSVNGLVIGKTPCLPVITPIELVTEGKVKWNEVNFTGDTADELTASQNSKLKRMLALVQTLDSDGDPSNGITVDSNVSSALTSLNANQATMDNLLSESSDEDFASTMTSLVTLMGGSTAVSSLSSGMSHFKTTLSSQTACTTSDVTGSASVQGVTPDCVALSCGGGYTLSNGTCVAKTACTTSDVSNSSSVSGYVEDGCQATACTTGFGLSNGSCVAMAACTTADVSNSTVVTGYRDNSTCQATACDTGYAVSSGTCAVSTASTVVDDAISFYNNYASGNDFVTDTMAHSDCSGEDYNTLKSYYLDDNTSGLGVSGRTCLDRLAREARIYATDSPFGLGRGSDILEVSGANDQSSSYFNVDGVLTSYEKALLDLMFD